MTKYSIQDKYKSSHSLLFHVSFFYRNCQRFLDDKNRDDSSTGITEKQILCITIVQSTVSQLYRRQLGMNVAANIACLQYSVVSLKYHNMSVWLGFKSHWHCIGHTATFPAFTGEGRPLRWPSVQSNNPSRNHRRSVS